MKVRFRKMQKQDIDSLDNWNAHMLPIEEYRKSIKINNSLETKDGSIAYLAVNKEDILAYFEIYYTQEGLINLAIIVNPKFRNKGHGRSILTKFIDYIYNELSYKKDYLSLWVESSNKPALHLYLSCGFKVEENPLFHYNNRLLLHYFRRNI